MRDQIEASTNAANTSAEWKHLKLLEREMLKSLQARNTDSERLLSAASHVEDIGVVHGYTVMRLQERAENSSTLLDADAQTSVCSVRALSIYIDRSASFRQSDQLFVCYGGCAKGRAISKQRLSHWIVDPITAAYTCRGLECPLHIRAHSTRAIASSWAWSRGMSIQDI